MVTLNLDRSAWQKVKFGDVVRNVNDNVKVPASAGIKRVLGLEHLDPRELRIQRWGDVSPESTFTRRVRPGQTLFGKRRSYQRKTAFAEFDAVCSGDILVFESADPTRLLPELLPFIAMTDAFYAMALETSAGSLSPRTRWSDIAKYEFDLPPLDQQRRIADLLWAVERRRVSGGELADAISIANSAFVDSVLADFSRSGEVLPLNDLIEAGRPITYGILKPGLSQPKGVPVIKVKDYPQGFVDESDLLLTAPAIDESYKRSRLREGDLLISIRGTVGRLAEVSKSLEGANITQDTARLSIDPRHSTSYVRLALESKGVQALIARAVTGLAVKGINIGELRKIPIPVPPSKEAEENLVAMAASFGTGRQVAGAEMESLDALRQAVLAEFVGWPR